MKAGLYQEASKLNIANDLDAVDQVLVHALNQAIRGRKLEAVTLDTDAWFELFTMARTHGVGDVILPAVMDEMAKHLPMQHFLTQWKRQSMRNRLQFKAQVAQNEEVFKALASAGVGAILLKGYSCCRLYAKPECRQMVDIDILIRHSDLETAMQVLKGLEYTEKRTSDCEYERTFIHADRKKVELHHHMTFFSHLEEGDGYVERVWRERTQLTFEGCSFPVLSEETLLVYLLMHMIKHFTWNGFNLRMLTDLTLLIEVHGREMDWARISAELEQMNMKLLASYLMQLCVDYLMLEANPMPVAIQANIYRDLKDALFEKAEGDFFENVYARYMRQAVSKTPSIWDLRLIMFPKAALLPTRYEYARRVPVLLPVAWVHRWVIEVKDHPERVVGLWRANPDAERINRHKRMSRYFGVSKGKG